MAATTIDEAYRLYMRTHSFKPPKTHVLKKFINDDPRVQMPAVTFVAVDEYIKFSVHIC